MHARQKIRHAVAAALATVPETADRVYPAKRYAWQADQLPGLAIYTDTASVEIMHYDREQRHTLNLVVEIAATATDAAEDLLDDLSASVEKAMEHDHTFGGLAWDCVLATMSHDGSTDGERTVAILRLGYTVTYTAPAGTPEGNV